MIRVLQYAEEINELCKQNKVKELYAFGSVLTDTFNDNSDIDFLVDFQHLSPSEYTDKYFNLKFQLEKTFGRTIDLLEIRSLQNPFLSQEINKKKRLLYVA